MTGADAGTVQQRITVSASRLLMDDKVVFAGIGMPLVAAVTAKSLHAPNLTIALEGGIIGPTIKPGKLPVSTNEMRCSPGSQMLTDITDIFLLGQRGYFDYGFLGVAQIPLILVPLRLRQQSAVAAAE
jgi:glutaconate CoA-transferase, subunit B